MIDEQTEAAAHGIGRVPVETLSADEVEVLKLNQVDAGRDLTRLVASAREHRARTGCRVWGCFGEDWQQVLGGYELHQLCQLLACAVEQLAERGT